MYLTIIQPCLQAISHVFHDCKGMKMNATKSMLGHCLGAAGAIEAVVCIKAITTGFLHPTLNLDDPESAVDMSRVVGKVKQQHQVRIALSNSFGFGGHNSAIVFGKYDDDT